MIAIAALQAGQYTLVKAPIAGAIVTNSLFMLGVSFVLGGCRFHVQTYNRVAARFQAGLLFLATVALLIPSTIGTRLPGEMEQFNRDLSIALALLLLLTYGLGLSFRLEPTGNYSPVSRRRWKPNGRSGWRLAHSSELPSWWRWSVKSLLIRPGSGGRLWNDPSLRRFPLSSPWSAERRKWWRAFSAARKNHLDLSISIALGSATQIALFVAPVLVLLSYVIGPTPMDLDFWPGAVANGLSRQPDFHSSVTNSGRSAWFLGLLVVVIYLMFAAALYLLPPGAKTDEGWRNRKAERIAWKHDPCVASKSDNNGGLE